MRRLAGLVLGLYEAATIVRGAVCLGVKLAQINWWEEIQRG